MLILLSLISLAMAFVLIFFLSGVVRDRAVHELARDDAQQTSKLVFQSLYSAMRKGWNKQEITDSIARLNESFPDLKINVYRGEIVAHQFGEMSGEHAVIEKDPELQRALADGGDALLFPEQGNDTLSLSGGGQAGMSGVPHPVACRCGAWRDRYHLSDPEPEGVLQRVINTIVAYTLLILGVVFIILYLKLRYLVAMPIANLVEVMRKVTQDMNLNHRVSGSTWLLELKHLAEYFNHLLRTVQEYNNRLEELSVRDPLTSLYNRRKFQEFLQHEIIRATRHQRGFSVIMIDLDNFKYINDTFGHPIGDMVLKEFTAMLGAELRTGDVLARMGGDEFAIILPETEAASGLQVANKLHQTLADKEFELPVGKIRTHRQFQPGELSRRTARPKKRSIRRWMWCCTRPRRTARTR